jgi:hypothetical protein
MSQFWKRKSLYKKVMETTKKTRIEDRSPHTKRSRENTPLKEKGYCIHCSRDGHHEAKCWTLHPDIRPNRNKKARHTPLRETTNQVVLHGNLLAGGKQLLEKGKLDKEDLFETMTEQMGKILELVESFHLCKSHVLFFEVVWVWVFFCKSNGHEIYNVKTFGKKNSFSWEA